MADSLHRASIDPDGAVAEGREFKPGDRAGREREGRGDVP
jgi:hypothetical protein